LLASQPALAESGRIYEKVSFYFAAHQDDWQLFMNPSAFKDVADLNTKVVFIHTTAGDAGMAKGNGGRRHPFYLARENGAETAIRFMATGDYDWPLERTAAPTVFNGHPVLRLTYRNTAIYFLRVPDGNSTGVGYAETGRQSLELLARGQNPVLAAIDGSTAYHGWADLTATIRAIIDHERAHSPSVQLNVSELDPKINPGDHSDHRMTAKAALDAASGIACARRLHYVGYASAHLPENLTPRERDMESAVFAVTLAGVQALDHVTAWKKYDENYVGRNYFRVEEGAGRCDVMAQQPAGLLQTVADRQLGLQLKK
jgi:hypothetical protein